VNDQKHENRFGRLLLLVFISTIMAEVLSGSITLSRIQFLPGQFLVYGSGVILIREISRRLQAGWPTILLLGLAFGLILEGLTLQSVFSPHFMGNNLTFGRGMGTNWVWTTYMTPFHAFFSICTPILLAEVIFDEEVPQPWAGRILLYIAGTVLLVMLTVVHLIFVKISHFNASLPSLIVLAAVIILLIFTALAVRRVPLRPQISTFNRPSYHILLVILISLAASLLWFLGLSTVFMSRKPVPWIVLSAAPLIIAGLFSALLCWRMVKIHTIKDRLALASGLLGGEMVFGYLGTAANPEDHYGYLTLMLIILILLGLLYRKVSKGMVAAE
jgi:predicted neutral ceramidase superfamily lipid hydrolase